MIAAARDFDGASRRICCALVESSRPAAATGSDGESGVAESEWSDARARANGAGARGNGAGANGKGNGDVSDAATTRGGALSTGVSPTGGACRSGPTSFVDSRSTNVRRPTDGRSTDGSRAATGDA
jgi:hypothetical protein